MPRHGFRYHPLYNAHRNMMRRCFEPSNPAFKNYGGRGVSVCARWHDLASFVNDNATLYRRGLTLDRINNDGDYEPSNCRWVSRASQNKNRRSVVSVTYNGETLALYKWAERLGINRRTLWMRVVERQWSVERAFTQPVKANGTAKRQHRR